MPVRKLTAIIFLSAFFTMQYGKMVSYWHCRIVSITAAAPCDCEKKWMDGYKVNTPHSHTTLKEKTEDIVWFLESTHQVSLSFTPVVHQAAYFNQMAEISVGAIFQPPRL